jgi:hypothetical protein
VGGGTWSASNANVFISNGIVTPFAVGVDTIYYSVASVYCGIDTAQYVLYIQSSADCRLGVETPSAGIVGSLNIYPNPVSADEMQVEVASAYNELGFEILDMNGKVVITGVLDENSNRVSISGLSKGIYLFSVKKGGQVVATSKFVHN